MTDDKGNKWSEDKYDGYGVFGGKDYHELLAEMNGLGSDRDAGIDLEFSGKPFIAPNLTEDPNWKWRDEVPKTCPYQGYFYYDYDEDDYEEEEEY
jgi:hypothetical protein